MAQEIDLLQQSGIASITGCFICDQKKLPACLHVSQSGGGGGDDKSDKADGPTDHSSPTLRLDTPTKTRVYPLLKSPEEVKAFFHGKVKKFAEHEHLASSETDIAALENEINLNGEALRANTPAAMKLVYTLFKKAWGEGMIAPPSPEQVKKLDEENKNVIENKKPEKEEAKETESLFTQIKNRFIHPTPNPK